MTSSIGLPPVALRPSSSSSGAYSGFCTAFRISDGLVVASCGLYCASWLEVAGVGHHGGVLLELVELVHAAIIGSAPRPGRRGAHGASRVFSP